MGQVLTRDPGHTGDAEEEAMPLEKVAGCGGSRCSQGEAHAAEPPGMPAPRSSGDRLRELERVGMGASGPRELPLGQGPRAEV